MMPLYQLLNLNCVAIDSTSRSKTAIFLKISQLLSQKHAELDIQELFDAYWNRESLGSTAIGQGVAIPHISSVDIVRPSACVVKLSNPVDFGAEDKQPVDLVIGLIVPQDQIAQHLTTLIAIQKQFSVASFRYACRQMTTAAELYQQLTEWQELTEVI